MRICLVDDESVQLELLNRIIDQWAGKNDISVCIDFYHSSEEMLFESNVLYPYDLILLDIQMGEMNGVNLAKKIRETDEDVTIAFVSGIADYVYEGYEVQAIRYILKPIKEDRVFDLLDYVKSKMNQVTRYLIITVSGEKIKINYDEILYFESLGHYITVHTPMKGYDYKYNIGDLFEGIKNTEFVRTHRSYIVNLQHIDRITRTGCELCNGEVVPLSRSSYKTVNERFIDYYKGKGV